ncbi:HpaII family restriction endonuclease [Acinetobacter seifertii]|uniref:HpaII family restriction endonuclease n=1 Tax=Acinetobacter seifertii TaxID=1530123 RepID=UPI003AF65D5A
MITGNIGEWSELYALFKILSDGELAAGDQDLNKINNLIYPVIKILRMESNENFEFTPIVDSPNIEIKKANETFIIPTADFADMAEYLLLELKKKHSSASFSIPLIEEFIQKYKSNKIKAKSSSKSDIKIIIYDSKLGITPELGFSIKSRLGKASTLLNAGKTTNFVYLINDLNISDQKIAELNSLPLKNRVQEIKNLGGNLQFSHLCNGIFQNNLILIDSLLPEIIAHALVEFYSTKTTALSSIVRELNNKNPLNYILDNQHPFYEFKIKKLLCETAIGMMPNTVWTGNNIDSTGGYLIIKQDGEIVCYHLYHRQEFEEYLYQNTRFETASTSRYEFGNLFKDDNGQLSIILNLQIRFK